MTIPIVPQLNLTPKRRKPLSHWNPLDYIQLLFWVVFSPRAVRWYVENFCEQQALNNCTTWAERRRWWKSSPKQRSFWMQGVLLSILSSVVVAWTLSFCGVSISAFGVMFGIMLGATLGVARSISVGVAGGTIFGVPGGIALSILGGFMFSIGPVEGIVGGISFSIGLALGGMTRGVGEVVHTQPVANPYVAGDPVEGKLFIGRRGIIQQLEELWITSRQIQSVVLFGHRRMGKTSILKNMSAYLGDNIKVAYVNLLNLGAVSQTQGEGEVLIALSDAISQTLSLSPPSDEDLLQLPSATFRRFIQSISQQLTEGQGLIIALDEFEKIEELITAGSLSQDFLGLLRGLLQQHANVAFAFAGLHTLEEMTEDYFNPLFASILPIPIGFLGLGETRQLLANPDDDFTLDYTPETLNEIYRLTAGQPYLTQLIGFQLVRHYNHQVFEEERDRTLIFTPQDLDTVIHHSDFFAKGRYYFTGVWNQAAQDAPGQQEILKVLAEEAKGMRLADICRKSGLEQAEISEALKTLNRHDVVRKTEGYWKIIVPLFRQWVMAHQR